MGQRSVGSELRNTFGVAPSRSSLRLTLLREPPPLQIEREQEEIMKMPDRFYKKFQKDVKQLRVDLLRRWG